MRHLQLILIALIGGLALGCPHRPQPAEEPAQTMTQTPLLQNTVRPALKPSWPPAVTATVQPIVWNKRSAGSVQGTLSLIAVGDVMLGRKIAEHMVEQGAHYPFGQVIELLHSGDVAFANLESPLCDQGKPISTTKEVLLRGFPEAAGWLREAGFQIISLANNHSLDYGDGCLQETWDVLDRQGLYSIGTYRPASEVHQRPFYMEVNGLKLAWLAYCSVSPDEFGREGLSVKVSSSYLPELIRAIREAKTRCDLVIVSMHWGKEYQETPTDDQVIKGHAAIEAGASLVLGQHPHTVQGVERYKKGVIFYSLGNFVFDLKRKVALESMATRIKLDRQGVTGYELFPMQLVHGAPQTMTGKEKDAFLGEVDKLSQALGRGHSKGTSDGTPDKIK